MKISNLKKIFITHILLLAIPVYAAADITVSLKLNRYEAAITDSVKMVVSISGSRDADTPQINGLENFIVQNAGRSSQIQIINGRVNSNLDFTYFLQPKVIGIFDIGPASVKIDGKTYQGSTVKLSVKNSVDQKSGDNTPVFLTASISSKKVYLEEQIQYTIRLYHLTEVSNVSLNMPEADGIEFKQLGKPSEYNTIYNSRNYQVFEIRYSLLPSKTGTLNINPARMGMVVRSQQKQQDDNDIFSMDDFFSNVRGRQITLASNPITLDVLPVPEAGKPADYAGLIGTYRITSELVPNRVKAGESATLTVTVNGAGNVNRIPDLKMPDIKDAKVYADEPKLEIQQNEKGIEGVKTMKWAIVPGKQGQYTVPPLFISFFDTANRYYNRVSTKPFVLYADPGVGGITQSPFTKEKTQKYDKEEVEELGKDILPIHRSAKDLLKESAGTIGWISWLMLILPALAYSALFAGYKISIQSSTKIKSFKAARFFYKISEDKDLSANSLSYALLDYFNNRFSMELGSLAPKEASIILKTKECRDETINQMEWILKKIETLIYTGKGEDPCDLAMEAVLIIKSIEKEIK
jgi:hypothetical protein